MVKIALALVVLVVVVALLVRLAESRLAFFPLAGETTMPRQLGMRYEALTIAAAGGSQLRAWRLDAASATSPAGAPRARIVYFHGNGGNLSMWAPVLAGIARQGYAVFAFDYRGYGESTGRPTERGLYRDVDAVVERFGPESARATPTIYWGRSLGGAMAAYAATVRRPDGLILESAFPDVRTLLESSPLMALLSLFSTYRFPTAEFMQRVKVPVLVMHGDHDRVVPFEQGRALLARIHGPKRFFTIRGGDHNDMAPPDPLAYWESVGAFIEGCAVNRLSD